MSIENRIAALLDTEDEKWTANATHYHAVPHPRKTALRRLSDDMYDWVNDQLFATCESATAADIVRAIVDNALAEYDFDEAADFWINATAPEEIIED